jgi:ubiquinone/menaquinone biosynthesis C-methylase UbiE
MIDTTTPIDKDEVHALWRARGPHWDSQADGLAEMADRMNRPLIEAAAIEPGHAVLDLASGAGEPVLSIAREVGPTGRVIATDLVEEMLAGLRRRAADSGLPNLAIQHADIEALPFEDDRFDRVTCRFGIMFAPDTARAAAEIFRVLKPGGRSALMVWGPREATTMFAILAEAADRVFGIDPRIDFTIPFRFGVRNRLAEIFTEAGFVAVAEKDLHFSPELPADRAFWKPQVQMSMGPCIETATAAEREALDRIIRDLLAPHRQGNVYKLRAHARILTAGKPEG